MNFAAFAVIIGAISLTAQEKKDSPIYRVTVVERTMKAINYQYRNGPTMVDLRGTVLLPKSKGEALVESKQGRTEIDVHLDNLTSPQGFGTNYMTYVLWAITPEGRPRNLGELIGNGSNKASLRVTTDLKAFGLLVTAEPYSAVRQPSDVVVAENQVREDTIGKIEQINVNYELMPRGHYTWDTSEALRSDVANAPKVSMKKYEALLELYQAQNAVNAAQAAGADRYAANTFASAQALLQEAQQLNGNKSVDSHQVVDSAREAAQTAEDARLIAERHLNDDKLAQAQAKVAAAMRAKAEAEAATELAKADTQAAQAQADAERAARQRAEAEADAARAHAEQAQESRLVQPAPPPVRVTTQIDQSENQKSELRMHLLEQLNGALATRDTAFGLTVTVPDRTFAGTALRPLSYDQMRRICQVVAAHPGLRVVVEGHSDNSANESQAYRRAQAVKDQLLASGMASSIVEVRPMGDARPLGSNNSEVGREQNRRVEIIISGDPIGKFPFWDRSYTLAAHP